MKKVLVIAGTRPEAVKLAPVVHELRRRPDDFEVHSAPAASTRACLNKPWPILVSSRILLSVS